MNVYQGVVDMQLRYKSAEAIGEKNEIWEVGYTGIMSKDACVWLGRRVRALTRCCPVLERLDRAVLAVANDHFYHVEDFAFLRDCPPGAITCRPDQFIETANWCMSMSAIGISRMAFLDTQLDQAQRWTAQFALSSSQ